MKYKLNVQRDVDISQAFDLTDYILNLPKGFCFVYEGTHVQGFDSMADLKKSIKLEVVECNCKDWSSAHRSKRLYGGISVQIHLF